MQFPRYDMSSFMFSQKVFRMFVYSAERDHTIRQVVAYFMCTANCEVSALQKPRYNGHPGPIIPTISKSPAKTNYRRLTEINETPTIGDSR